MKKYEERTKIESYEAKHFSNRSFYANDFEENREEKWKPEYGKHFEDSGRHFAKGSTPKDTAYNGRHFKAE